MSIEVTTLQNLPDNAIVDGRRMGNSTRVADHAIQELFSGKKIHVQDHWENGRHDKANKFLFRTIMDRLKMEHPGQRIKFDEFKLTIELLP